MEKCYASEKEFVGCMMALETILLNGKENSPHQIQVNGLNLEIVPLNMSLPKTSEEDMKFKKERREYFSEFLEPLQKIPHNAKRITCNQTLQLT